MGSQPGKGGLKGPRINTLLAYAYGPLRPLLRGLRVVREGRRDALTGDVLLPDGFEAEVVATDLNEPVHAAFGPDGACYVSECGYKIDSKPRVLGVDVQTGAVQTFFELRRSAGRPTAPSPAAAGTTAPSTRSEGPWVILLRARRKPRR